ncbi:MAG TPA: DegT/DnrJ/EryC1/StrS family aminotransferase [Actinocrinis sp.]|nr:DegT/DnrJ/EryC1/StrS family aminotransferase [Actinocrinis sp.]
MPSAIALGQPTVGAEELAAVAAVFETGWLAGQGPRCREFELAFARLAGTRHALAVNNCTAALHLAVSGLRAEPGDEVIVADYTFPATGHAVRYAGATPVFADVRPDTWTVDPQAVAAAITPRTVGVIAVDSFGQCADYDELTELTARHGLWLIEDAACAAGATYHGCPAGSFGNAACFSFHGRKGISAGEGGALTTDDDALAASARKVHNFGIESAMDRAGQSGLPIPVFDELGYNYKLSDLAAAVMEVQLRRLPDLLAARRRVAEQYAMLLAGLDDVVLPYAAPDREHAWQSYVLTLGAGIDRGAVAQSLRENGIGCTFGTYASHLQPVYGQTEPCPVSADLFARHLAIPMHANLGGADVERVAEAVAHAVKKPADQH